MAEQPLSVDKGVYLFFEMIALGFVLTGVDMAVKGEAQPIVVAGCFAAAVAFFLIGIFSSRILAALGSNAVDLVEWLARYTWLMVLGVAAYVVTTQPVRARYFALGGVVAFFFFSGLSYVRELRRDINRYVMPRRLTGTQKRRLQEFLNRAERYSITIHANPADSEAREYAGQLISAFQAGKWMVQFDTRPPYESNEGLSTLETGSNQPKKNDAIPTVQQALGYAGILINGSGSVGAGEFSVSLRVGRRPLAIYRHPNVLTKIGRVLIRVGMPR
ncbi:MAG TPA: hypothetical protein VGI93_09660 [Steroidobacteraceae bacterium]|jgi:hypothetical protein